MKFSTLLLICLIGLLTIFTTVYSQNPPRLQAIHNAADPGLAEVDVDITLLGQPVIPTIENVAFRSAIPFIEALALPIPIIVEISKQNGTVVLTIPITLENDKTYIGVVRGVEDPAGFAANPNGLDISLDASLIDNGRETSTAPGDVQFILAHGVTDAPTIDLNIQGGSLLVNNLSYGNISAYVTLPAQLHVFDITDETGTNVVASFRADLSDYADSALTVFASGFLDPSQNQNGAEFGLFAALPGGTVIEFPKVIVGVGDGTNGHVVTEYRLAQNYPNPFNPSTTIEFSIPARDHVTLSIFNSLGQRIETPVNQTLSSGSYKVEWNAAGLPGGIYFYRFSSSNFSGSKKMILLK
jgi:hypothetical protein